MTVMFMVAFLQELMTCARSDSDGLTNEKFDIYLSPLTNTSFRKENNQTYSLSGFTFTLDRSITPFFMNIYLPTSLLTTAAFIGFLIPVDKVPGRMALLVTIFLMLVNISSTERNKGPVVSRGCLVCYRQTLVHIYMYKYFLSHFRQNI